MHYSSSLLHIDLSGSNLPFESCLFIARAGISKSRTLVAAHMSGMGLLDHQMLEMRRALKVTESKCQREIKDEVLNSRYQFASMDFRQWRKVVTASGVQTTQEIFEKGINTTES